MVEYNSAIKPNQPVMFLIVQKSIDRSNIRVTNIAIKLLLNEVPNMYVKIAAVRNTP